MAPHIRTALLAMAAILATAAHADPDPRDRQDQTFVDRGFVGTRKDPLIRAADGRVVWDLDAYAFVTGKAPPTVHPSLWRHAGLLAKHGLFKVADGVWQVRGFDVSNVTFIAGKTGWIVIDPLTTTEVAAAALQLANERLGARPVSAVIYTHSHADHFGGVRGVVSEADMAARTIPIVAPQGFLDHAVSENVIAGPAMTRRAAYQFGTGLPRGPEGQVSVGLGLAVSQGTNSLIPPTIEVKATGEAMTIDGIRFEFQMTPGTEAPAEMNFYLPDLRVLDLAENANMTMHNVLTPRGALVRDAKVWADGLTEALSRYGARTDTLMASHGWPRFGQGAIVDYLGKHRDAYKYLHDQSVRLMNDGLTGVEIAEQLTLPAVLANEWYNRGYYGSYSFNARAVYQRYMGWYDGNPVHLQPYAPKEEARRYVLAMGGRDAVFAKAQTAHAAGDDRWASELLNRLVQVDTADRGARDLLAASYTALGRAQENAVWRAAYLTAAMELKTGIAPPTRGAGAPLDYLRATSTPMLLDLLAVRLVPDRVGTRSAEVVLRFPERDETVRVTVRNGVLVHERVAVADPATLVLPRAAFLAVMLGGADPAAAFAQGTPGKARETLVEMRGWFAAPKGGFPVAWSAAP